MKTFMAAAVALPLLLASGCESTIHGNGQFRAEARTVPAFDGVSIGLGIQASVQANASDRSVTISGDSNVLQYIETKVVNGVLQTKLSGIDSFDSVHRIQLAVATPSLVSAAASADADVSVAGIEVDAFSTSASEGSTVVLAGADASERTFLTASVSGTSSIDAVAFPVADGAVTLSGGSTAHVDVSGTITCSVAAGSTLTNVGGGACAP